MARSSFGSAGATEVRNSDDRGFPGVRTAWRLADRAKGAGWRYLRRQRR